MEDADLLHVLKEKDPELVAEIMQSVFKGFRKYSTNLEEYRVAKRRFLEALSN